MVVPFWKVIGIEVHTIIIVSPLSLGDSHVPIADLDGLLTFGLIDLVSLFFQSWLRVKITHLGLNFISSAFTISRPTLENGKLDTKS